MKQVKGAIIIRLVKAIKTSPKGLKPYEQIFSDKAKEFLKQRILSATWYPFEEYRELYDALSFVEVRNNPSDLIQWGINGAKLLLTTTYQSTIYKEDIKMAFEKYSRFHKRVFNFGEIVTKFISITELEMTFLDMPHDWQNYYYVSLGYGIAFIELCTNIRPEYSFLNKSWEREGWTKIKFTWDH
ncbi:MAG: hypothetical protein ACFFC3_06275 [Candidatus Odinarchaeota archaeon]